MLCQAGPSQNGGIFLKNCKSRGANLLVCCRRDEFGLAISSSHSQLWSSQPLGISYNIFSRFVTTFTGIFLRVLQSEYSFSDGGRFLSSKRSYGFLKNRSFGGVEPPEGLEIVPDILTQIFLEIRFLTATGAGSDQPCSAGLGLAKMDEFFSRIVKAGERTFWGAAGEMS